MSEDLWALAVGVLAAAGLLMSRGWAAVLFGAILVVLVWRWIVVA